MTALPDIDVAVIGAGVIGLSSAAALAKAGKSVVVLECNAAIARETTSRNSEVVHAGIYYPKDSLKAQLCIAGRRSLYLRCEERGIAHRKLGKWIVATRPEEIDQVEALYARGVANGVEGLELLSAAAIAQQQPDLQAVAALHSPHTGIVDAHALALSYQAEAEAHGAQIALQHRVEGLVFTSGSWRLEVRSSDDVHQSLRASAVVNAAGLAGDRIAALAGVDIDAAGYRLHFCKGDYFALSPGAPLRVRRLLYPVPSAAGLGIHATIDLGGRVRFGPDTTYVDAPRYDVDASKAPEFAEAVRRYLPSMRGEWLAPDYAGVRPKLSGPGEPFRDFVIECEASGAFPGLVNCIGIESPGLTAAGPIGERVAELLTSL